MLNVAMEKLPSENNIENKLSRKEQFKELLDKIDYGLLEDIFKETFSVKDATLLRKAIPLVPKEQLVFEEQSDKTFSGVIDYAKEPMEIVYYFNPHKLGLLDSTARLDFLEVFIHEQIHAVGFLNLKDKDKKDWHVAAGFSQQSLETSSLEYFNEAVTQSIAEEVFYEYVKRNHDFAKDSEAEEYYYSAIRERGTSWDASRRYSVDQKILGKIIETIALKINITQEAVWKAIKRAYYEEGLQGLLHEDVAGGLEEIFSVDFLERLELYGTSDSRPPHPLYLDENYRSLHRKLFQENAPRFPKHPALNKVANALAKYLFGEK